MAIGSGTFTPSSGSYPLLAKIFQVLRFRVYYCFIRLLTPVQRVIPQRLAPTHRLPSRRNLPSRILASVYRPRQRLGEDSIHGVESLTTEFNLPVKNLYFGDFELECILDRLCIDPVNFRFVDLQGWLMNGEDLVVSAWIPFTHLSSETGLCLEEVGRQLGQLGLVAVSACHQKSDESFFIGKTASMEESQTRKISPRFNFIGVVRNILLQSHRAEARVELWQRNTLVCQMSVQYDIYTSWQEVLQSDL